MRRNFRPNGLQINVSRKNTENQLSISISSDYSQSNRKSRLFVRKEPLVSDVETLWKSIKTKKLLKLSVSFSEQDYYDDMTDIYTTPVVKIERGLKKARVSEQEHGSIPKEWGFDFDATMADTTTSTPIIEVVKTTLGSYFTPKLEKDFKKLLKPVLQKKKQYCSVETPYDNERY